MDQSKLDDMTRRVMSYSMHMNLRTYSGIATFFRANLADDLSQIDIALVGLPTDAGLTQRTGARHGPREIRNQSCNILYYNPLTKVIPFDLARIADVGDVPLASMFNLATVIAEIRQFYDGLHQAGVMPITAGGDHSISYPILGALGARRRSGSCISMPISTRRIG
jgi:guanidinopropionase